MTNFQFVSTKTPDNESALTNCVILNEADYKIVVAHSKHIQLKDFVFKIHVGNVPEGSAGFSAVQRRCVQVPLGETLTFTPYKVFEDEKSYVQRISCQVSLLGRGTENATVDRAKLADIFHFKLSDMVLNVGQQLVFDYNGYNTLVIPLEITNTSLGVLSGVETESSEKYVQGIRGLFTKQSVCLFQKAPNSAVSLVGDAPGGEGGSALNPIFRPEWDFNDIGIGGLDKEFADIFRRAFASRVFPAEVVNKLGVRHVKGLLLYGPPGTGKTLIARQIGKMLTSVDPKIVNGPEILSKYVGQSEENIRKLFAEAEAEEKSRGDDSNLHIIIFDEIDAICKQRGSHSDNTGVHDTVVNQLLSKIDGVEQLNNILLIGMTNRLDLIDEALLRPGRFEVHVEINLPDEDGRRDIFKIHTKKMQENGKLSDDVDILTLAKLTKNYSGAEIEGVVKSSASFALNRQIDPHNMQMSVKTEEVQITMEDFLHALNEVRPAFGVDSDELESYLTMPLIDYGPPFAQILKSIRMMSDMVRHSDVTPLVSVLIHGEPGTGKTAIAAHMARESGFPYIKVISPEHYVGMSESVKVNKIAKVFHDAYRTPLSVVILDDIERMLEYVRIGPRFSNPILQALIVLLKQRPPKGKKLLVLCTTSSKALLEELSMVTAFDTAIHIPALSEPKYIEKVLQSLEYYDSTVLESVVSSFRGNIAMKKLILAAEMALQAKGQDPSTTLVQELLARIREFEL
eukprot:GCRY01002199.1.p1 GENE.GCRY01002199.1~~GCRY01002199.1.p1  ORF type:complete len:740 (-),score=196.45 GCRY01002199.1:83-2302(-)